MNTRRTAADDEVDRQTILSYVRARPGERCEEAEIARATGVWKGSIRRLVRDAPGIDQTKLDAGVVCWNAPDVA
jgi:hypothetical protein